MRSATDVWPGGLGSSSGELGHNLMDHHFRCGANGVDRRVRGPATSTAAGPTGFYIPRFRNLFGDKRAVPARLRLPGQRQPRRAGSAPSRSSASAARSRTRWRRRARGAIGATAFGEMLPNHANRVTLDETKKDKWGLPVLAIDCATGENERLMRADMMNDMAEMLEAAGVKRRASRTTTSYFPGMGIHEMGTARMGRDPKTSVLNAHNQVWDCAERVRHRRLVHDLGGVRESVAHLHGAHGARGGVRRRTSSSAATSRPAERRTMDRRDPTRSASRGATRCSA